MDVIRAFLKTLWKMFAGDLPLSLGALAVVAISAALARSGVAPAFLAPLFMAAAVLLVFGCAVIYSTRQKLKDKTKP